jgi:hypothetical protein
VQLDGLLDLPGLANLIELQTKLGAFAPSPQIDDIVDLRFSRASSRTP